MSMNLYCKEISLWQTPTWISFLALYDSAGKRRTKKETLHIYTEWVRSKTQGVWMDATEYENMKTSVSEHLEELSATNIKRFEVY